MNLFFNQTKIKKAVIGKRINLDMNFKKIAIIFSTMLIISCASKKNILYFQDIDSYVDTNKFVKNEPRIRKNDLLSITVSSVDKKSAQPFNLPIIATGSGDVINGSQRLQSYLVDANGNIEFPVLGKIRLSGLTKVDAVEYLKKEISKYVINPIINLRIINFKVSVLGEVNQPGTFSIQDERITILEALSRAGDMTILGKREDVLLIREEDGKKTYNKVDFRDSSILNSPYYFLQQNDVVLVSPSSVRVQSSSSIIKNTPLIISVAGAILSILTFLNRN